MPEPLSNVESFSIAVRDETLHVRRHIDFANGAIDLDLNFTVPNGAELSIGQIDQASLRVVLEHLQLLLDRNEAVAKLAPPAPAVLPPTAGAAA